MALESRELYTSTTQGDQLRLFPAEGGVRVKTLGPLSAEATLLHGLPMAYDTSNEYWVPLTQGGTNGTDAISGFLYEPQGRLVGDTDSVQANIMLAGRVHRDEFVTAAMLAQCGGAMTSTVMDAALAAAAVRMKNIDVEGLANVA